MPHWFNRRAINRVILTFIVADLLLALSSGFLTPIYAVFITEDITGGTVAAVGFATSLFWFVKSLVQFPVSWVLDATPGERDDFYFMLAGSLLIVTVNLCYFFFADAVWHVYLLEILNGIGYGLNVPAWYGVFTRHIDPNRESTEWTMDSNAMGLGTAVAAAMGGVLAEALGFRAIFLLSAATAALSTLCFIYVRRDLLVPAKAPATNP